MATEPWALILAGGDGWRLQPLTEAVLGIPQPKQYCPLMDGETLLERTRRRVEAGCRGLNLVATSIHSFVQRWCG